MDSSFSISFADLPFFSISVILVIKPLAVFLSNPLINSSPVRITSVSRFSVSNSSSILYAIDAGKLVSLLAREIKENCETIKIVPTVICFKANEILQNRIDIDKNKFLNKTFKIISGADASLIEKYSYAFFNKVLNNGGEGTLVKSGVDGYKPGKPTYQIKKKMEFECELKIVGFKQGTEGTKYENSLGALVCESSDGKVKADPSGLKEDLRDKIWSNQDDYLNKIITVRCHKISKSKDNDYYSLLHPRFIKFRDDKMEADSYEEIAAIEDSIKNLK